MALSSRHVSLFGVCREPRNSPPFKSHRLQHVTDGQGFSDLAPDTETSGIRAEVSTGVCCDSLHSRFIVWFRGIAIQLADGERECGSRSPSLQLDVREHGLMHTELL